MYVIGCACVASSVARAARAVLLVEEDIVVKLDVAVRDVVLMAELDRTEHRCDECGASSLVTMMTAVVAARVAKRQAQQDSRASKTAGAVHPTCVSEGAALLMSVAALCSE